MSNKHSASPKPHAWETGVRLYEAYNDLATAAGGFEGKVETPAVVVVGQQTDGKSALVEALMGFQFNHVGGGTKTRRPVELRLRYNPDCDGAPFCRLVDESQPAVLIPMPLEDVQAYIEKENMRLETDPCQFSEKEIVINIEYKYCPNLTIIDTPGLIIPAPGHKNRILQSQARAVETLVRSKLQHREFIILCLEDCSDWINATTRRVVMQIDPELSRTVLVSTKLDTKIPQFARASDVEVFLKPVLDASLLGDSPFFTSVPSGRVGSGPESVFSSNEHFKKAICKREMEDIILLEEKLGRVLTQDEKSRIGVSSLRLFLEQLLQKRYIESVPSIIPLLDKEFRCVTRKLKEVNQEMNGLDEVKLKEKARIFHDSFLTKLSLLLKGTVVAPPDKFGETLLDERINGGTFTGSDSFQLPHKMMPNAGMRLYGGAQYHRAMAEFRLVVGGIKCPPITREEIVNACGVEDLHDGTNYSRTACVIAVSKARETFQPFLHQLGFRLLYILKRLLPISVYLLQKEGEHLSGHEMFLKRVESAFNNFAESTENSCRAKCMEDLESTTRYVTWSLHNKNRAGLRHFLDSFSGPDPTIPSDSKPSDCRAVESPNIAGQPETRLVDLLDSTLWNRRLAHSSERLVCALVHQIFHGIKEQFLVSTELKFNCFLLMPVVDQLPALLREDLESVFQDDFDGIFNVTQLKSSLEKRKRDLEIELKRIHRLKEKFREINEKLSSYKIERISISS